jgi:DNA ligase (NAD+)
MDIENLGEKIIQKLVSKGLVYKFSDFYKLKREDLATLEGFKEKSISNVLQSIEISKNVSLDRFILALGIPHIGAGTAQNLAEACGSIQHLLQMTENALLQIEGIGPKAAKAIKEYFAKTEHTNEIYALLQLGVNPKPLSLAKKESSEFSGKIFVLTGALQALTRDEATKEIKKRGGKVANSVSKKTHYVIAGQNPGSKYEKAKQLGIKILSEQDFLNILNLGIKH